VPIVALGVAVELFEPFLRALGEFGSTPFVPVDPLVGVPVRPGALRPCEEDPVLPIPVGVEPIVPVPVWDVPGVPV
jgi:hypothetical protein